MKALWIGLLLISSPSFSATYINWGVAVDYPSDTQYSDVQNYAVGYRKPLKVFDYLLEAGAWKDGGVYPGAKPAFYGAAALGIDLKLHEKYVSYFVGPSCISAKDTLLGSAFQVYQRFSIGWRDSADKRIGFFLKHFSNGGLSKVNYGRNFVGIEVSF